MHPPLHGPNLFREPFARGSQVLMRGLQNISMIRSHPMAILERLLSLLALLRFCGGGSWCCSGYRCCYPASGRCSWAVTMGWPIRNNCSKNDARKGRTMIPCSEKVSIISNNCHWKSGSTALRESRCGFVPLSCREQA